MLYLRIIMLGMTFAGFEVKKCEFARNKEENYV